MSSPEAVYYAFRGYFSKIEDDNRGIKKVAFLVFKAGGFKGTFDDFWPERTDDPAPKESSLIPTPEEWERIIAGQKKVDAQIRRKQTIKKKHG